MQETGLLRQPTLETRQMSSRLHLPAQKRRQMTGHGRILRVGQAQLGQRRPRPRRRPCRRFHDRKEPFHQGVGDLVAGQFGAQGAADQLGTAARHHHRHRPDFAMTQQGFLGRPATVGQTLQLPGIELDTLLRQLGSDRVCQGQIHVVAAQQNMLADRHPHQFQGTVAFGHGNQRKVGGTAAQVDHQDDIAKLDLLAPPFPSGQHPVVQGRLRFFQQHQMPQADRLRRFGGQFAGGGIEGGRHGQHHVLLDQWRIGMLMVPSGAQVFQIADRGLQRRNLSHFLRRFHRQDGGTPIHPGMTQPAFGAGHQANRRPAAHRPRQFADHERGFAPRQNPIFRPQFVGMRQVEKRGQHRPLLDRAGRGQLRNEFDPFNHLIAVAGGQIHRRQHTVGGTQIDAHRVTSRAHSSTSAGAST